MAQMRYQPISPFPETGWNFLSPQDQAAFMSAINQRPDQLQLNPQTTHVGWRQVPFYESAAVIRAVDTSWQPSGMSAWFIGHQGVFYLLDGNSEPIHRVNAMAPIRLNDYNHIDYLKFFCTFVYTEGATFRIIERLQDLEIYGPAPPGFEQAIAPYLKPVTVYQRGQDGSIFSEATLVYQHALYHVRFQVQMDGQVTMLDDKKLPVDLPRPYDAQQGGAGGQQGQGSW